MTEDASCAAGERDFEPRDRVRRAEASEGEQAGDDYFVLDLNTGKYYSLGGVGGFIWSRLDGTNSLAQVAHAVTVAFEVGDPEAESDVLDFVTMLEGLGLLEVA